jgi:hypothetical protein
MFYILIFVIINIFIFFDIYLLFIYLFIIIVKIIYFIMNEFYLIINLNICNNNLLNNLKFIYSFSLFSFFSSVFFSFNNSLTSLQNIV